ncbi:MAG: hypothetical protein V4543_08450 [Bacteroidota bacterium]
MGKINIAAAFKRLPGGLIRAAGGGGGAVLTSVLDKQVFQKFLPGVPAWLKYLSGAAIGVFVPDLLSGGKKRNEFVDAVGMGLASESARLMAHELMPSVVGDPGSDSGAEEEAYNVGRVSGPYRATIADQVYEQAITSGVGCAPVSGNGNTSVI